MSARGAWHGFAGAVRALRHRTELAESSGAVCHESRHTWNGEPVEVRGWFDEDRAHRYLLSAWWRTGPRLPWIMLNPSLAGSGITGDDLDPTLRRVRDFTRRHGWPGFDVLNLYPLVDPDPSALEANEDPEDLGPNGSWLRELVQAEKWEIPIVVAWGAHPMAVRRARVVGRDVLEPVAHRLVALHVTARGHPGHPLYLRRDLVLGPWRPPSSW